ncbi:hypothetical protein GCM10011369_01620 [Neiella marina]|uniref:Uncharacterized protein n=1 Tax=Neiella marina TaxID=508461 RepID=A0A8J2U1Q5_9GAMM|nr:hypothetical protein [Neiella marina]GGA63905.1 hypothetical protein GCM10011369_01620 [Neiella marina]
MSRKAPRIEPTLFGDGEPHEPIVTQEHLPKDSAKEELSAAAQFTESLKNATSRGYQSCNQFLRSHILSSRKNTLIAGGVSSVVVLVVLMSLLMPSEQQPAESTPEQVATAINPQLIMPTEAISRSHPVEFPDNFSLWATEYNGMVISWKAEQSSETTIWDIATADGDQSCEQIVFNNGDSYRSLDVLVERGSHYFASFSPLDSIAIVNNIALRGSFKLCGYQFSLKGSQAILNRHPHYSELLIN